MKRAMIFFVLILSMNLPHFSLGQIESDGIREIHQDIILLNLLNGLYLSPDQVDALLPKIQEAENARQRFRSQVDTLENISLAVMQDIRGVLISGSEIPDEMKKSFHQLKKKKYELEDQQGEVLMRLESEVSDILTPNQKVVIDTYKPCVIPLAEGKIGQDRESQGAGLARMLDRIRSMPDRRYHHAREMLADLALEKTNRHIGFESEEEKDAYRKQLFQTFNKARSMSDKEFLIQKQNMANALIPDKNLARKHRKNQLGRIGRFLLDSALIPLLGDRQSLGG